MPFPPQTVDRRDVPTALADPGLPEMAGRGALSRIAADREGFSPVLSEQTDPQSSRYKREELGAFLEGMFDYSGGSVFGGGTSNALRRQREFREERAKLRNEYEQRAVNALLATRDRNITTHETSAKLINEGTQTLQKELVGLHHSRGGDKFTDAQLHNYIDAMAQAKGLPAESAEALKKIVTSKNLGEMARAWDTAASPAERSSVFEDQNGNRYEMTPDRRGYRKIDSESGKSTLITGTQFERIKGYDEYTRNLMEASEELKSFDMMLSRISEGLQHPGFSPGPFVRGAASLLSAVKSAAERVDRLRGDGKHADYEGEYAKAVNEWAQKLGADAGEVKTLDALGVREAIIMLGKSQDLGGGSKRTFMPEMQSVLDAAIRSSQDPEAIKAAVDIMKQQINLWRAPSTFIESYQKDVPEKQRSVPDFLQKFNKTHKETDRAERVDKLISSLHKTATPETAPATAISQPQAQPQQSALSGAALAKGRTAISQPQAQPQQSALSGAALAKGYAAVSKLSNKGDLKVYRTGEVKDVNTGETVYRISPKGELVRVGRK